MKKAPLLLFPAALALWAADVWQAKPFTEWSDKDIAKIMSDSPWAKKVSVTLPTSGRGGGGPPAGGPGGGGGGGGRGGGRGGGGGGGGGADGGGGGDPSAGGGGGGGGGAQETDLFV